MENTKKEFNWSKWGFWLSILLFCISSGILVAFKQMVSNYFVFIIAAVIFVALLIYLFYKRKEIEKKNIKYFIVSALAVLSLTISILSLPYFREKQKIRVAVLLPFTGGSALQEDGAAQLKGIFRFIGSFDGQKCNDEIEYVFLDHKNEVKIARDLIDTEITKKGTRYFFSTMSSVNSEIAKDFNINKSKNNPILVCAVTSFPDIATSKNAVYRYYVRSEDEAPILAEAVKDDEIKYIIPIIVGDNYGEGSYNAFKKCFTDNSHSDREIASPIKYSNGTAKKEIKEKIQKNINLFNKEKFGILIAHYGSGIDDIISSLAELGILSRQNPTLYVTSTLHSKNWSTPIKTILDTIPYYIAVPNYYDCPTDKYEEDVEDFSYFAFERMIKSITLIKRGRAETFEDAWQHRDIQAIPKELPAEKNRSKYLNNGDTEIQMTTIPNNIPKK